MLRYEYIPRAWIVSPTARLVYQAAGVGSLALVPLLMGVHLAGPARPFLRPLVFPAVVGTALELVGMEYFLLRLDDSPALKQVFWFCAMLFVPLGPALYCFLVYSRSNLFKNSNTERQRNPGFFQGQNKR